MLAGLFVNPGSRHLALLHTALAFGMSAAADSRLAHNRPPPGGTIPSLPGAEPPAPSCPEENAVAGVVAAAMVSNACPKQAGEVRALVPNLAQLSFQRSSEVGLTGAERGLDQGRVEDIALRVAAAQAVRDRPARANQRLGLRVVTLA